MSTINEIPLIQSIYPDHPIQKEWKKFCRNEITESELEIKCRQYSLEHLDDYKVIISFLEPKYIVKVRKDKNDNETSLWNLRKIEKLITDDKITPTQQQADQLVNKMQKLMIEIERINDWLKQNQKEKK
jgi:hypothetical protein